MKVFLIILCSVCGCSFLSFSAYWIQYWIRCYFDYVHRMECVQACEDSYYFINNELSYIIGVEGTVGAGKTSLVVGCSQYNALNDFHRAGEKKQWIQSIVPYVDYSYLEHVIDLLYEASATPKAVYDGCLQDDNLRHWFHGVYDDYINKTPLPELLRTYIDAHCAILRNQFVGANIGIFCPITKTWSFQFEYRDLEIKEESTRKNYLFPKYTTIVEDEALLSIYKNTNSFSDTSDTGLDLSLRLIRHLSKETSRIYSTAQSVSRMTKLIRELSTNFIHVNGYEIVGQLKTKDRRLAGKERHLQEELARKDSWLRPSDLKNKAFRIHQERKRLFAGSYLCYTVTIYSSLEDLGKKIDNCECPATERELCFPLTWIFGCYQTHEFKFIDEILEGLSNRKEIDLQIAKEVYSEVQKKERTEAILKKVKSEKEKADAKRLTAAEQQRAGLFRGENL